MKILSFENVILVIIFAFLTFFAIITANQFIANEKNNLNYNYYYTENLKQIRVSVDYASEKKFKVDVFGLADSYVIYYMLKDYYGTFETDVVRTFYGENYETLTPNILSGHFFTPEEIMSEEPLCVLGEIAANRNGTVIDGVEYYEYNGMSYRVIGKIGIDKSSDLDLIVLLNWGGYTASGALQTGKYIIDDFSAANAETAYNTFIKRLEENATERDNLDIKNIAYERTVKSLNYVSKMIFNAMTAVFSLSVILISVFYIDKRSKQIAIKKFLGFNMREILFETALRFTVVATIGFAIALAGLYAASTYAEYSTSELGQFTVLTTPISIASYFVIFAFAVVFSVFPVLYIYRSDTSRLIK